MINKFNIERSFEELTTRNWKRLYWFVDFHGTIAIPDYGDLSIRKFYNGAKEVLQFLSKQPEICLVLWTCSHKDDINQMLTWLEKNNIKFEYVNENPECKTNKRVNLETKPYYNVLLDDRAGFDNSMDWILIKNILERHYKTKIPLDY